MLQWEFNVPSVSFSFLLFLCSLLFVLLKPLFSRSVFLQFMDLAIPCIKKKGYASTECTLTKPNTLPLKGCWDVKLKMKSQPCHVNDKGWFHQYSAKDNVGICHKKGLFYCKTQGICLFSGLKHSLNWLASPERLLNMRENVLAWHLLKDIIKFCGEGFYPFSVICWKVKSNLLVDSTCDGINPDHCFPPRRKFKSASKSITSEAFYLKLGAHLERKKGVGVCHKPVSGKCPLSP